MTWLILYGIAGLSLLFLVPFFVPERMRGPRIAIGGFGINLWTSAIRFVGVLLVLIGIATTSFVVVGDGHFAQVFKVMGGTPLTAGKIVAINGETGPQGYVIRPGLHFSPFINLVNNVDTAKTETNIPNGQLGVLTAKDGVPLRAGQAFADPFPTKLGYQMLDAETFLKNGGQQGPQLTVLPPGKYVLNTYLWQVDIKSAQDIEAGFVGVVKSNVHAAVDFGTLKSDKPEKCDVMLKSVDVARLEAPIVPVGCIGIWKESLQPGKYYIHPDAFSITRIDTRAQVWTYAGGYKRSSISLTVDSKGEIQQTRTEIEIKPDPENADVAIYVRMEGWDIPLELRVIAQVSPENASCVVAGVGTLKQVEDRVLTPSIRAITRDVAGGTYELTEAKVDETGKPILDKDGKPIFQKVNRPSKALDLINQRPLLEGEIERRIRPEAEKSCVLIREVRLGEPAIPPELLVAVRREQLAGQLAKAYQQEKLAQDQRIASEKSRQTANNQENLVKAEIGVKASEQNALAAKNEGDGQRDKLTAIAEGQQKQVDVLGAEATVGLRRFEYTLETLAKFFNEHPEVLTAALTNAQKFVPNVQVSSGISAGGGLDTMLLATFANQLNAVTPSAPATAPTPRVTAPAAPK